MIKSNNSKIKKKNISDKEKKIPHLFTGFPLSITLFIKRAILNSIFNSKRNH